ncbi:MAG: L-threonylcarbamoyladenylate synthase [Acidimicrobiia bacterium]|nr:L-threonylcarbamoyladenylate synthase [Acidimicrobiia bacterium]
MTTIDAAVAAIHRGLIVGVPTDTVYGLAVDPLNTEAVAALYELKGRPDEKAIPVLVATVAQALEIVDIPPEIEDMALRHWPGPLTLVLRRHVELPDWVGERERGTVAVRIPDHPVALDFLSAAGPLAVTSANRSGNPPAQDEVEARELLGSGVAVYLEGRSPGGEPSTVVDMTTNPPRLVREGPVTFGDLLG